MGPTRWPTQGEPEQIDEMPRIGAQVDCFSCGKPQKKAPDQGSRESPEFPYLTPRIFVGIAKIPKKPSSWTRILKLRGPRDCPTKEIRSESMKFPQIEPPTTCLSLGEPPRKCLRSRISRIVGISLPPPTDFCRDRQDRKSATLIDPNPHARGCCVARANARHRRTRPKSIRARKRTRHHTPNPIDSMRARKRAR